MNVIIIERVDEIIEIVETRFNNANVEFDDETRDSIIRAYENEIEFEHKQSRAFLISFDLLHDAIECNLRSCIATQYANEFVNKSNANIFAIANENTFHEFTLIHIDEFDNSRVFCEIRVNDDLSIVKLS